MRRNRRDNQKSNQEPDRNREYDYVPARDQRKLDLQKRKKAAENLPRIPKKRKRDEAGPSRLQG